LPTRSSCSLIAATASGSMGVVAAWSRYVRRGAGAASVMADQAYGVRARV
jgi:hypothetical protein